PCRGGGLEARECKQRVAPLKIFVDSFLQDGTEILPDLGIGRSLLVCESLELAQYAARHRLPDCSQDGTFLDHLARKIERQGGRGDEAPDQTQIARQDLRFAGDYNPVAIK